MQPLIGELAINKKQYFVVNTLSYKTISATKESVTKDWILIDAENQVVGRLASHVAKILRGKHKPTFTPHADTGDKVIIINAEKVRFTGNKMEEKQYVRHTGYPGGQRFASPAQLMVRKPEAILESAIRGMLPKNRIGDAIYSNNLFIYKGSAHPHDAQQPKQINLKDIK